MTALWPGQEPRPDILTHAPGEAPLASHWGEEMRERPDETASLSLPAPRSGSTVA
jgi:hypothetical protein